MTVPNLRTPTTGSERFDLLCDIGWTMRQLAGVLGRSYSGVARWFDDRPGKRASPPSEIDAWLVETAGLMREARHRAARIAAGE